MCGLFLTVKFSSLFTTVAVLACLSSLILVMHVHKFYLVLTINCSVRYCRCLSSSNIMVRLGPSPTFLSSTLPLIIGLANKNTMLYLRIGSWFVSVGFLCVKSGEHEKNARVTQDDGQVLFQLHKNQFLLTQPENLKRFGSLFAWKSCALSTNEARTTANWKQSYAKSYVIMLLQNCKLI